MDISQFASDALAAGISLKLFEPSQPTGPPDIKVEQPSPDEWSIQESPPRSPQQTTKSCNLEPLKQTPQPSGQESPRKSPRQTTLDSSQRTLLPSNVPTKLVKPQTKSDMDSTGTGLKDTQSSLPQPSSIDPCTRPMVHQPLNQLSEENSESSQKPLYLKIKIPRLAKRTRSTSQIERDNPPPPPIKKVTRPSRAAKQVSLTPNPIEKVRRPLPSIEKMILRPKRIKTTAETLAAARWIKGSRIHCFRDRLLTLVDSRFYHLHNPFQDDFAKKIILKSNISFASQMCEFIYATKKFIALSWLTTLRIFEFDHEKNTYIEVKRIPNRYIPVSPKLITCVHSVDLNSKLYIAYLWGSTEENADKRKPFIEIRNISGKLLCKPQYYDDIVVDIYSDQMFVYVITRANKIYLHRPELFNHLFYCVDLSIHTSSRIIKSYVDRPTFESYSNLPLLTSSSDELLIVKYSINSLHMHSSHKLPDGYKITGFEKFKKDYVIYGNLSAARQPDTQKNLSIVEVGNVNSGQGHEKSTFTVQVRLDFKYHIVQLKVHKEFLYIFGYRVNRDGSKSFEIGCAHFRGDLKWTTYLNDVNISSRILIHTGNIVVINDNQEIITIDTAKKDKFECKSCKVQFLTRGDKTHHDQAVVGHTSIFLNHSKTIYFD